MVHLPLDSRLSLYTTPLDAKYACHYSGKDSAPFETDIKVCFPRCFTEFGICILLNQENRPEDIILEA